MEAKPPPEGLPEGFELPEAPEAPELAKWLPWLHHHANKHREAFMKPPVFAAILVVGIGAYYLGSHSEGEKVGILDERVEFLTDQLSAYKDRLQGATPDEAAKRFSALERKLEKAEQEIKIIFPDKNRALSQISKSVLLENVDRIKHDIKTIFVYSYSIGDSPAYAYDFIDLFKKNSIPFIGTMFVAQCDNTEHGVMIGLTNLSHPSEEAQDFMDVLNKADVKANYTRWVVPEGVALTQDFDLFVCPENPTGLPSAGRPAPAPQESQEIK